MDNPFFSVIIPAFNSAAFIRKGLDSIKAQSFKYYELIIVCDLCEDNTEDIAREYTDKVYKVNHHIDGQACNTALDNAKGKWVLFMDDDDWFLHEFAFEMLANRINEAERINEFDILAFSFIIKGVGYAQNTPYRLWPALWNKCWRREFIGDTRLPNWEHSNDIEFARQMHPKARFIFWDMPFYYYNFMRPGCVSEKIKNGQLDSEGMPDDIKAVNEGYKQALNNGGIKV